MLKHSFLAAVLMASSASVAIVPASAEEEALTVEQQIAAAIQANPDGGVGLENAIATILANAASGAELAAVNAAITAASNNSNVNVGSAIGRAISSRVTALQQSNPQLAGQMSSAVTDSGSIAVQAGFSSGSSGNTGSGGNTGGGQQNPNLPNVNLGPTNSNNTTTDDSSSPS